MTAFPFSAHLRLEASRAAWERIWLIAGTFLICLALLAFELSTVRTINYAIGPSFIYVAIAIAMLGMTAAGSLLSMFDLSALRIERGRALVGACLAIAGLLVASQFLVAAEKAELNRVIAEAGRAGGLGQILPVLLLNGTGAALKVGLFLCLPYFLFGALLSYLFATARSDEHGGLYAADLIGAAVGCAGAIVAMETTGYAFSVTAPAVVAALAAAAFAAPRNRAYALVALAAAALLCVLPLSRAYEEAIEPPADPHYLVRDYDYRNDVAETWRRWNSYTRVGAIERRDRDPAYTILSLANGDGMAWLWPYDPSRGMRPTHSPAVPAMLRGPAKDTLVLFAGAGADMMTLKANGFERIVGVELNRTILDAAEELRSYRIADFLADPNVVLEIDEGRGFLERDRSTYDVILMSWSGATAAYYMGALGGTTQYLFTYEGLSAILDHLKPDGHAVVLQVNKVRTLAALRRYMEARQIGRPDRAAIVLFKEGAFRAWDGNWDDNPLLFKPSGWSGDEVARVVGNARLQGFEVAYAPGMAVHPDYSVYQRILTASDLESELAALRSEHRMRFDIVTDDRPFYLDNFSIGRYLGADFWFGLQRGTLSASDIYHLFRIVVVVLIGVVALVLAVGPLLIFKRLSSRARGATYLTYFLCLGAGFMFLEIAIMQKSGLVFGNPGLTIALVLGGIILFTGIGSLVSNWCFRHGLTFRAAAAFIVAYIAALVFALDPILHAMIAWPLAGKIAGLCLVIAPGALFMGQLFPQGLALARDEDATLVPWAWAVNGAMSAFIAGLAPLIAQALGFQSLLLAAGLLYGLVILLPVAAGAKLNLARA